MQEQSYYPFGLQMAGISSRAFNKLTSSYKFNGGVELEEELNIYSTFYRQYDQQIGRFNGVDTRSEEAIGFSNYSFSYNNPLSFNDPLGDLASYVDANGDKWHSPRPLQEFYDFYSTYGAYWTDPYGNLYGGGGGSVGTYGFGSFGSGDYSSFWNGVVDYVSQNINSDKDISIQNRRGEWGHWETYGYSEDEGGELANAVIGAQWVGFGGINKYICGSYNWITVKGSYNAQVDNLWVTFSPDIGSRNPYPGFTFRFSTACVTIPAKIAGSPKIADKIFNVAWNATVRNIHNRLNNGSIRFPLESYVRPLFQEMLNIKLGVTNSYISKGNGCIGPKFDSNKNNSTAQYCDNLYQ